MKKKNYKVYTHDNEVVAVTSFARRPVRAVAKCDPRDTFDVEFGKALAIARCDVKVADKRLAAAKKRLVKAHEAMLIAKRELNAANKYFDLAQEEHVDAYKTVATLTNHS